MDSEEILSQTLNIVNEARIRGLTLRLAGGAAIRIHSHTFLGLLDRLLEGGNKSYELKDVDMVTYRSQREDINKLFIDHGFKPDKLVMAYFGDERFMYHQAEDLYDVDVFFEKMRFSHELDLGPDGKGRLGIDFPTIPPVDLLLEKLQIHEVSEKDIIDLIVLLRAHTVKGDDSGDSINIQRIDKVLSSDWGFWFDAKNNLEETKKTLAKYMQISDLCKDDSDDIQRKIDRILACISSSPKSSGWLKRSKMGTKKTWWLDVEELVR